MYRNIPWKIDWEKSKKKIPIFFGLLPEWAEHQV